MRGASALTARRRPPPPACRLPPCSYLPLNNDTARQTFYNFYPSEAATAVNDSLIVWLQG